jgi:arabinose-5-phosphate isomerase
LILTVKEIMVTGNDLPCVSPDTSLKDAVISMSSGKLGIVLLCDSDKVLSGILTDGDLRRILQKNPQSNFLDMPVSYYASCSPKTISGDCLAEEAISKMENKKITSLIVVTTEKKIEGVVHLHQLLSARVI